MPGTVVEPQRRDPAPGAAPVISAPRAGGSSGESRAGPQAPAHGEAGSGPPMVVAPMDHPRERPLYRERAFHLAALAGVAFLVYRVVRRRRRRRGLPSANLVTEAVLVVDLVGSTRVATHYGDAAAMRARLELRDRARVEAERRGLLFTERTGDGRVMTFRSVRDAVDTASALASGLAESPPDRDRGPAVAMHAAITYGELLVDARGGRHGTVLNKAFRLDALTEDQLVHVDGDVETARLPSDNRILLDEEAAQESERIGTRARKLGFCRLKGFSGLHRVYALADTAAPRPSVAGFDGVPGELEKPGTADRSSTGRAPRG
jgi:class 3 adenylate cyclase